MDVGTSWLCVSDHWTSTCRALATLSGSPPQRLASHVKRLHRFWERQELFREVPREAKDEVASQRLSAERSCLSLCAFPET